MFIPCQNHPTVHFFTVFPSLVSYNYMQTLWKKLPWYRANTGARLLENKGPLVEASLLVCKGMDVPKTCMPMGELLETGVNMAQDCFMRETLLGKSEVSCSQIG